MLPQGSRRRLVANFPTMPGKKPTRTPLARRPALKPAAAGKPPTVASLARRHAEAAIAALIEVVGDRSAPPAARISAAGALLNWGFGKSSAGEESSDGPAELVIRWRNAEDEAPKPTPAEPKRNP